MADAKTVQHNLVRRRAIRDQHPPPGLVQHDEPIDEREQLALHRFILANRCRHSECSAGAPRQALQRGTQRHGQHAREPRERLRHAEPRQVAGGALAGLDDAVAGHAAPLHQLAAPAHVGKTRQVAGDDDADTEAACLTDLGKADAGGETVHVQDVGTLLGEKAVEPIHATNRNAVLRLVSRRRRRRSDSGRRERRRVRIARARRDARRARRPARRGRRREVGGRAPRRTPRCRRRCRENTSRAGERSSRAVRQPIEHSHASLDHVLAFRIAERGRDRQPDERGRHAIGHR